MSRGELTDYIDTSISDLGKSLGTYLKQPSDAASWMMKETALALAVMCNELDDRRSRH
jgi:hypothetical protein